MGLAYIWVATLAVSFVVEFTIKKHITLCISLSSAVAVILHFCKVQFVWQAVVFAALSAMLIALYLLFLSKRIGGASSFCGIDEVVGEKAVVVEKIDNFAGCGQVKIHGESFSARGTEDTDVFMPGEIVHIVAIEGVKLICKK